MGLPPHPVLPTEAWMGQWHSSIRARPGLAELGPRPSTLSARQAACGSLKAPSSPKGGIPHPGHAGKPVPAEEGQAQPRCPAAARGSPGPKPRVRPPPHSVGLQQEPGTGS